jgi:hypothetical protein
MSFDHYDIREHVVLFYNQLFSEHFSWRPNLDGLVFDSIAEEPNWQLVERQYEEYEGLEVVKGMNSDKVQGHDGFTMAFFQVYWDVI